MRRLASLAVLVALAGCGSDDAGRGEKKSPFEGVEQHGAVLGAPDAPYTLVEFADLQCPFCAEFHKHTLSAVVDEFVRPGKLRLELRPISFLGADSSPAAAATVAAGEQNHMWDFASRFYEQQGPENSGYVTAEFIGGIARSIPGLDFERFQGASNSKSLVAELKRDAQSAKTAGIVRTPGFRFGRSDGTLAPFEPKALTRAAFLRELRDALRP